MGTYRCACHRARPVIHGHPDFLTPSAAILAVLRSGNGSIDDGSDDYCTCTCHLEAISGAPCSDQTVDTHEFSYRPAEACWDELVV